MTNIASVINFCSNDYPFLRSCIEGVSDISSQIIVPVCDHYFDGEKEDLKKLGKIYAEFPQVQFVQFPYDLNRCLYANHSISYWHNLARLMGLYFVRADTVLFLDADEIFEVEKLKTWVAEFPYSDYDAIRLANYWYFRDSRCRATEWEDTPLLIKREHLTGQLIMQERERAGTFAACAGNKVRMTKGLDGLPMCHHYSWVRTKEQMLRKVRSWGHHWERNWEALVEEEFSRPFNGRDFVHGYTFNQVEPYAEIDLQKEPIGKGQGKSLQILTTDDMNKIDLALTFDLPFLKY